MNRLFLAIATVLAVQSLAIAGQPSSSRTTSAQYINHMNGSFVDQIGGTGGTISGAAWTSSLWGQSLYFDGLTSSVAIPTAITTATNNLSFWVWFKVPPMTATARQQMIICSAGNMDKGIGLGYTTVGYIGAVLRGLVWATASTNGLTGASGSYNLDAAADRWHLLMYVRRSGINFIYLDAVRYPVYYPTTAPLAPDNGQSSLGKEIGGSKYFTGYIDEVGSCNRALSDAEISMMYSDGMGRLQND